jgi:uncharacterized protein YegL
MSVLINLEAPKRRVLPLIFIVETSGGIAGHRITAVNEAFERLLPLLNDFYYENNDAEIKTAILEFSSDAHWIDDGLKPIPEFKFQELQAGGLADAGKAFSALNEKLNRTTGFFNNSSGFYFAPILVWLNCRGATDNWQSSLKQLQLNKWFQASLKLGVSIESDEEQMLIDFTGNHQSVVKLDCENLKAFVLNILCSVTNLYQARSSNPDLKPGYTKQDEFNYLIKKIAENIEGVSIASDLNKSK